MAWIQQIIGFEYSKNEQIGLHNIVWSELDSFTKFYYEENRKYRRALCFRKTTNVL